MALSHISAPSQIESFTEKSNEAEQVRLWYDYSLKQVLESFDWSFARTRLALAIHSEDPPDGIWAFRYQYPEDCIVARKISNPTSRVFAFAPVYSSLSIVGNLTDAVPFEIELDAEEETKTILTNMQDAILVYTKDITTTSLFSALFIDALSHLLAHHMAYAITRKRSIRGDELQIFRRLILTAPAMNANERVDEPPREAEWIRGRG